MTATLADFRTRYPEFASIADARVNLFLADAVLEVGEAWGSLQDRGVLALAAHTIKLDADNLSSGGSSVLGQVSSRSVGDVSVSFAVAASDSSSSDWYRGTPYGLDYLRLKRRVGMSAIAVGDYSV